MSDLVLSLLIWINQHSQLDVYIQQPNIIQIEQYSICRHYGIVSQTQCEASRLIGFYDGRQSIYLPLKFKPVSAHSQSQLLHELVHYVQWQNMHAYENYCLGEKEVEAYRLQNQWRQQHGLKPAKDEFTLLMLAASCEE